MNIPHKIDIDIQDILRQVAMTSAYMAVNNNRAEDNSVRLEMMEVDEPLVASAVDMAYRQVCEILQPYTLPHLTMKSPHHFTLFVRHDVAVSENTVHYWEVLAADYMKATILTEWLRVVAPETANSWSLRAQEIREQFVVSLTPRIKKPRKMMEVI